MYFPLRGSQTTIWLFGSKHLIWLAYKYIENNEECLLEGQVLGLETLVTALRGTDDWCITDQWVMDSGIRNQVGLELIQIDVESTIES